MMLRKGVFGVHMDREAYMERYIEREQYRQEMIQFIKENNIVYFSQLVDYARENRPADWFPFLCDCPRLFRKSLK